MKLHLERLIILPAFLLLFIQSSYAQTITIGSGTQTSGFNTASPVNIFFRRQVSHTVYTAAELNAAGITGPATINRLGYFVTNSPIYNIPGYTIQLKHTTAADASGNLNGGFTTVKNAFTYAPASGDWDMIDLDTPFLWDGVQNLVVRICWSPVQPSWNSSGQLRTYNSANGYKYRRNDNGGSLCNGKPNNVLGTKPQIRFVFETETIWTGAISTDWNNAANWTAGVPDETMDARIPIGVANNPNLTGTGTCLNLTNVGTLTVASIGTLNLHGNFNNSGIYMDQGGTFILVGDNTTDINSSSPIEFSNLLVESGGATILGNMVNISGELQVNRSTLNTNDSLTILSSVGGTGRIDELRTECFYTLNMLDSWGDGWNGATLTVLENGAPIGTYQASGTGTTEVLRVENGATLQLSYALGSLENENSYTLHDPNNVQIFTDGPDPTVGMVFTTTATCGFTAPITGEITMERYIDAGETYWRYFGSAVKGADLAQFNDDFVTAGYPGSLFPAFGWVSAYNYDEAMGPGSGYLEAASATQVMGIGEGWQIWCGDTITGTEPFTFDLRGVPNQGDINLPVTYTNTGTPNEDGFNLVSNPYPSTVDWDDADWTKTNMANAVYIQNPDNQQYATYIAGASTNGGSPYIASQQSFWVQSFAASPVLTATEGVKSSVDQAFIRANFPFSPGMQIILQGDQEFDEVVMRHIDAATDDFDYAFDATKYWGGWGMYPQLSLLNGAARDLTIHSFDKMNQQWKIPLRAIVFQTGFYNIEFNNIGEMNVPCMILEDTYSGTNYPIVEGAAFTFEMYDTTYVPRFIIHVGRNYNMTTTAVSCFGDMDGQVELDLDQLTAYDYELLKDGNSTYGNDLVDPLTLLDLESGVYSLEIPTFSDICGTSTFNFVINEPQAITSVATLQSETFGGDGSISVQLSGGSAPYDYMWSTGATSHYTSGLVGGTYDLVVADANGCTYEETFTLESDLLNLDKEMNQLQFIYNAQFNRIEISGLDIHTERSISLYSMSGNLVQRFTLYSGSDYHTLQLIDLSEGVYILQGEKEQFKFKR